MNIQGFKKAVGERGKTANVARTDEKGLLAEV